MHLLQMIENGLLLDNEKADINRSTTSFFGLKHAIRKHCQSKKIL